MANAENITVPCTRGVSLMPQLSELRNKNIFAAIIKSDDKASYYKDNNLSYLDPSQYHKYASIHRAGGIFTVQGVNRPIFVSESDKDNRDANRIALMKSWTGYAYETAKQGDYEQHWENYNTSVKDFRPTIKDSKYYIIIEIPVGESNTGWVERMYENHFNYERLSKLQQVCAIIDSRNPNNKKPIIIEYSRNTNVVKIDAEFINTVLQITIMAMNAGGAFFGFPASGELIRPYANILIDWAKANDGKPLGAKMVIDLGVSAIAQFAPQYKDYATKIQNIYNAYDTGNYGAIATELGASGYLASFAQGNPETFKTLVKTNNVLQLSKLGGEKYSDISNILTAVDQTNTVNQLANNHENMKTALETQKITESPVLTSMLLGLQMNNSTVPYQTANNTLAPDGGSDIMHSVISNPKNDLSIRERQTMLNVSLNLPVKQEDIMAKTLEALINKTVANNTKAGEKPVYDIPSALPESTKTCIEDAMNKNGITTNRTRNYKRKFFSRY